jgi:BMFP domain-containing protein YqiC
LKLQRPAGFPQYPASPTSPLHETGPATSRGAGLRLGSACIPPCQPLAVNTQEERIMTTTSSRLFDELAKMMGNAAGAAQGLRREIDGLVKSQVERVLGDLAIVQREEFEAVREMAERAREENEQLKARIDALEAAREAGQSAGKRSGKTAP